MATRSSHKNTVNLLRELSIPLIAGVVAALVVANVWPDAYRAVVHFQFHGKVDLEFLVNEIFMALFFGIAAVEITDSVMPGGALSPPRKAVTPLLATAGGVIGPVGVYFGLNAIFGAPELSRGWGIAVATDIALAWLVARLAFGKGHPAISFLLLLAIADDAVGLAMIAIFYPDPAHAVQVMPLLLVLAAMGVCLALRKTGVKSYWPYLLAGGVISWTGLYLAHLHPALALVFVVPFMPHGRRNANESVFDVPDQKSSTKDSTLIRFEHEWKVIVDFGLLLFGFVNAGVPFTSVGTVTGLVFFSLLIGKTLGIFIFAAAARPLGFGLPQGMTLTDLLLTSMIAGIGLTVALFVATVAFPDPTLQGMAKMAALASAAIGPLVLALKWIISKSGPRAA